MIEKVIKCLKNGSLFIKVRQKIPIYYVSNKNIANKVWQWKTYLKLKRKYNKIIRDFELSDNYEQKESNIIWVCWLQGIDFAPDLVKACVNSIRVNLPDKEIIVIDENNLNQYIEFPEYINKKWKSGKISPAHFSDLIRIEILCRHGGTWIDATVLCTAKTKCDYIFRENIFVFKEMDLGRQDYMPTIASNWFIHAKSNNNILLLTRNLLYEYWRTYNHTEDYYIFHLFFAMAAEKCNKEWESIPMFNNNSPHTLQFELQNEYNENRWNQIIQISDFHKLNRHKDFSECNNCFYDYILKTYC